jgi:uncharacterized SAM-binding protein YcdF (DUF218 family)
VRSSPLFGLTAGALAGLIIDDLGLASIVSFWGDMGPLVLIFALSGAFLWTTRARQLVAAFVTALGLIWLVAAFTPLAGFLATGLVRRDSPATADAVFVAASSIQQSGELTATSMSRLVHGIELIAGQQAPALVLSDLKSPHPSYAGAAKTLLEHLGLTTELLTISGPNENTHDEAVSLARSYREREWKRVIVVTSPYHSRRACAAVEHEGLSVVCSPSAETRYDLRDLAGSGGRRLAFSDVLHERIGLLVYRWRGWITDDTAGR